jgi:hypothetical protein
VTTLRAFTYPLRLVRSRLASGGERLGLVAFGVVAGAAVIAAVLAGRLVMQDRSLALATSQLSPGDREVQVAWSGASDSFGRLNAYVAPTIERLTGKKPLAAMLFREASIQGRLVNVRAANDLDRWVKLLSGRLPSVCVPSHCEVLRLKGAGPIPSTKYLRLIEVGRAVLKDDAPFGPYVLPTPPTEMVARAVRYHTPQPSPVVIANGVAGLSQTKELETFYRQYAWFVPLEAGDLHPWSVGPYEHTVQRLTSQLEASPDGYIVDAPSDTLFTATASARSASRRLLLLGGESGALLLAFTVLAASALRRDVADARRRLTWFGARRWQVELFTLAEAAALALLSTILGWLLGGLVGGLIAGRGGSPVGGVLEHSLLSTGGVVAGLIVTITAALLLYVAVRAPAVRVGALAFTPLDAAAVGAIGIVLAGWARGSVAAPQLASGSGTSGFLLLVPGLIVFAAAVVSARLLTPTLRFIGRGARRGPISVRLAAASLARNPGHAAIAATFLVASLGLALFAVAYRSTLERGQRDEATYSVPAQFVLSEDFSQLVPVLHGAPPGSLPQMPTPVVRLSGNILAGATFGFLALPARSLGAIDGWRHDFSRSTPAALGRALRPGPTLRTVALPVGRRITLPVETQGDPVGIRAFFRGPLGDIVAASLGHSEKGRRVVLQGRIPFRHATLVQLQLDTVNNGRITANGGLGIQPSARGVLTFGVPRVNGKPIADAFRNWIGTGGVNGARTRIAYLLTTDRQGVYRPRQTWDGKPIPVLATPAVAAAAGPRGVLPLVVEGEPLPARVVGTVKRFPSIVGDAVVADLGQAEARLDTTSPGLGTANELWVNSPDEQTTAQRLAQKPFTQLTVTSQAGTLARLRSDPLARGALLTLAGTAAVALLLALVGLLLSVAGDVRDDRGELFDLEAQGASPATIRAHLRLRALFVAVFGILGGIGLGAILSALVIALVSVTATSAEPEPPLQLHLDLPLVLLAAVGYVVAATLLVAAATALRGKSLQRAAEGAT